MSLVVLLMLLSVTVGSNTVDNMMSIGLHVLEAILLEKRKAGASMQVVVSVMVTF